MKSKPLWAVIALAIAAALTAFVTTFLNGCSVAVHGRLVSWAALVDQEPPPVPDWGPFRKGDNGDPPAPVPDGKPK